MKASRWKPGKSSIIVGTRSTIVLLFLLIPFSIKFRAVIPSSAQVEAQTRGLQVLPRRLLPPEAARVQGHPKLVALLVGEDYSRGPSQPEWGQFGPLPGVWQDLGRIQRRLRNLGFGKIVVLAGNRPAGSSETVTVRGLPGVQEEPEGVVTLTFAGPATRAAMIETASQLRDHLTRNRTVDDGRGGEVPPLFLFYFSGHGFVNVQAVHSLPLADNLQGEPTGDLIRLIAGTVGADDPARGSAGGGSALIFLDSCQAGQALQGGARSGVGQGGLLESEIMDAIRAGRRGRFFVGASLGDERAKEGEGGGHFTGALCAALSPAGLGEGIEKEATLSLNHLVLRVDRMLLDRGVQAVSRFPPPGEVAWDNYVLFANPHYREEAPPLLLYVTTVPAETRIMGEEGGSFRELELLSGGFSPDPDLSREGRRVYRVPGTWRGRSLRLRAEPATAEGWVRHGTSPEVTVVLQPDARGGAPMAALALEGVRERSEGVDVAFARAQELYEAARVRSDPLEQYRQYQACQELLVGSSHPFAAVVRRTIEQELIGLRPRAGAAVLDRLIQAARAPALQDRYREAYDRLGELKAEVPELREFEIDPELVRASAEKARGQLVSEWAKWAETRRRQETERRLAEGEQFLHTAQPWQSWRLAFESQLLTGGNERVRGLIQRSEEQAIEGLFNSRITLDVLVSNGAYGILTGLITGEGAVKRSLERLLKDRYKLGPEDLGSQMEADRKQFRESHADWFPPGAEVALSTVASDVVPPVNPRPGDHWISPVDGRAMVWIPPGRLLMGSPANEPYRDSDEKQHEVKISQGFWMDATEVTNEAYQKFVLANPQWQKDRVDRRYHDGDYLRDWNANNYPEGKGKHPVVYVSWYAGRAYAEWAGKRLPTEAEWEYAARAATTTAYWWRSAFDGGRANNNERRTEAVGNKAHKNPWGLYDMSGNVWEWCSSRYAPYPYRAEDGRESPIQPGENTAAVLRGGSWYYFERNLRSADRNRLIPTDCVNFVGFRCAR